MAIIKSGASTDQLTIDATSKAARTTLYDTSGNYVHAAKVVPLSLGSYSLFQVSGLLAAGSQSATEMYQFRWSDATRLCSLRKIMISFSTPTVYAAGQLTITATVARGFTAVGSGTASTAATLSTNNTNKKKTAFGYSLIANTACVIMGTSVLSAGTKTLDTNPFAGVSVNAIGVATTPILLNHVLWEYTTDAKYPFVFAQDEGFIIRISCPGTGTAYFSITTEWDEMTTTEL